MIPIAEWKKDPSGPPMIPYDQVTHDQNGLTLDADELEIVWTMEGSGAGLLYRGELIAFISEWASHENFPGYSRYIRGETPFGWEMTQAKEHLDEVFKPAGTSGPKWRLISGPCFRTARMYDQKKHSPHSLLGRMLSH